MQLLTGTQTARIESHLKQALTTALCAEGLGSLSTIVRNYVMAGGKRIRPQLVLWTWAVCSHPPMDGDDADLPTGLLDVACAWELFHAFLLAHDDIIDASDNRRDAPSLHKQLAELDSGSAAFGTNLAIVAGDLLFSVAMRLMHDADLDAVPYRDVLRMFSSVACVTGFGQSIDILQSHEPLGRVTEETLLREYHWKTAAYTFEGPMLCGAIIAGASRTQRTGIERYARALGQAYQMHNDLLDLAQPITEGSDLVQGKRTPTILSARAALSTADRTDFDSRLNSLRSVNGGVSPAVCTAAEQLRREILDGPAIGVTQRRIAEFLAEARATALTLASDASPLSANLLRLLAALETTYFQVPQPLVAQ